MIDRLAIGRTAERRAEQYLHAQGVKTLLRNFRCRGGELDLVAEHDDTIVVVEVRKRSDSRFGDAADSVDHHKQRKLIHAAGMLLQKHPQWEDRPLRFDVVGIDREQITWIQDAFQA